MDVACRIVKRVGRCDGLSGCTGACKASLKVQKEIDRAGLKRLETVDGDPIKGLLKHENMLFNDNSSVGQRRHAYISVLNIVLSSWHKRVRKLEAMIEAVEKRDG